MKNWPAFLLFIFASGCATPAVSVLQDRTEIEDTLVEFAVQADAKDWTAVQGLFMPKVKFLMGTEGKPSIVTPQEMTSGWQKSLQNIQSVHHQIGNFRIRVGDNEASAKYYGVSIQYKPNPKHDNVRVYVGTYDVHLVKQNGKWKIDELQYLPKFTAGNLALD